MKRFVAGLALLAAAGIQGFAGASHGTFDQSGGATLPNPATPDASITLNAAPCKPGDSLDGLDAKWYNVDGFGDHNAVLTPGANMDFDAWFFSASCAALGNAGMAANFLGTVEKGTVPTNAAFIGVVYFAGPPNGTFKLAIS